MDHDLDDGTRLMLHKRDIFPEDACKTCAGYGVKWYSSGATWRGGVGTMSTEKDVCNHCWGSGSQTLPWLNLKTLEADKEAEIQRRALTFLADAAGTNMGVMQPAIKELVLELEKFNRSRKARPPFFIDLCLALAKALTER